MGRVFDSIKLLVSQGRYVVSEHAVSRLEERRILEWQVVDGVRHARLLKERERDRPHPSVEVAQLLADGTEIKAVWSHVTAIDVAQLVTVHFLDD